jgi:tRNA nucleotidyltransferase/poly(A) polymerase
MSSSSQKAPIIYPRDQHTVSRRDIDQDCLKIMLRLNHQGYKAYLVGGGVRDLLLGKKPKDFDVSTDATPKEIRRLFGNARIIGRRFRLVHILFPGGKIIQVSTFRDSTPVAAETPEENAPEAEAKTLQEDNTFGTAETDAYRRDLTINGLFYSLHNSSVIDYVGGVEDLNNKVVRIIGDPVTRFIEDPVRLIRAVRHSVRAGFSIESKTLRAIEENTSLLTKVPKVRLYEEIKKDLTSGHCLDIFLRLRETGILSELFPSLGARPGALDREILRLALHTFDTFIQGGRELSHIIPLALIAVFAGFKEPDIDFVFEKDFDVDAHIVHALGAIQVSKREKESIEYFITWWSKLSKSEPEIKLSTVARSPHLAEFNVFATILSIAGVEGPVLERVGEAMAIAKKNPPQQHSRRPHNDSRRRRPRNHSRDEKSSSSKGEQDPT